LSRAEISRLFTRVFFAQNVCKSSSNIRVLVLLRFIRYCLHFYVCHLDVDIQTVGNTEDGERTVLHVCMYVHIFMYVMPLWRLCFRAIVEKVGCSGQSGATNKNQGKKHVGLRHSFAPGILFTISLMKSCITTTSRNQMLVSRILTQVR
jgi:hypothetical protein